MGETDGQHALYRSSEFYERFAALVAAANSSGEMSCQPVDDGADLQARSNTSPVRFVAVDATETPPRPVADTTDQEVSGEAPSTSLGLTGEAASGSSAR